MSKKILDLSEDVRLLCEPYFKCLGLDHFNYIHRDNDGLVTYLCSNQQWLSHYLKKSYPKIGAFEQNENLSQYKYILWNGLDRDDPILIDSKEMLGVEYGITIIKHENDGVSFYNIGSKTSDSSAINKYVNSLDQYENFILDFQEKASSITRKAKNLKLNVNTNQNVSDKRKDGHYFGDLYLTNREIECVNYLSRGKTAEEMAIILNISKRTVETHISNIKNKMNCFNQFRLGYLLGRLKINIT